MRCLAKYMLTIAFMATLLLCLSHETPVQATITTTGSSSITPTQNEAISARSSAAPESPLLQTVSHKSPTHSRQFGDMINDIQIECNSDHIVVTLNTNHGFNGMIYPKGLSKNSTCMTEYHQIAPNITYHLPLRSCNTMSSDVEDGVEYFNTVIVQPHRRLVTNQGRGYHIRCRYQTKERTITNQEQQLSVNLSQATPPVIGSATMPSCTMKIYSANDLSREVAAENVRIGDELHLVIALDDQDVYGMLVTNCLVRDGMNWGEQPLIDDQGCPVDEDIMPQFVYAQNLTSASVTFQAHKFPYTSSVYYQCNVRLCFREGGCNNVPPVCDKKFDQKYRTVDGSNDIQGVRQKRWVDAGEVDATASEEVLKSNGLDKKAMNIEVFSGLHVDESELEGKQDKDPMMMASTDDDPERIPQSGRQSERDFCMSMRKFAIVISLASLLLMAAVLIMIACMIQRRKREKANEQMYQQNYETPSQMYDHYPYEHDRTYNNRAYCRN